MRPVTVVAVVGVLLVAGCSGTGDTATSATATTTAAPTTTETTTTTARSAPVTTTDSHPGPDLGIDVMNGPLPYDPNVTYARVQRMLGTNQSPPGAVMVIPGMEHAGSASDTGRVFLDTDEESVLAHEFAHSILLRAYPKPAVGSPDAEFAANGLVEGAAEYVEAAYVRRYLDGRPNYFRRLPADPARAYFIARYYFGYRYVDARVDSPAEVPEIHQPPPNTSEQVMHGLAPGEEPPRALAVAVADRHLASNASWRFVGQDRLGEMTAFLTLRTRLDADVAATGADGWGNDRLVGFEGDGQRGFVWVLRWDDPENATEFATTARAFRNTSAPVRNPPADDGNTPNRAFTDRVWYGTDASLGVRRVGPETVVLVVGPDSFVDAAQVSPGNGTVSVGVAG